MKPIDWMALIAIAAYAVLRFFFWSPSAERIADADALVYKFERTIFESEVGGKKLHIRRWEHDVVIGVAGEWSSYYLLYITDIADHLVRHLARATGLRLLIIDELHSILASPVDKRSMFLNTIKHLSNELELPIVLIGTVEAVRAIQTDQQMGNRFEPVLVPRWKLDSEYATFLSDLAGALGVGGNFGSRELIRKFHTLSEGLTGETWRLLVRAAQELKPMGADVDLPLLDILPWRKPSDRRNIV